MDDALGRGAAFAPGAARVVPVLQLWPAGAGVARRQSVEPVETGLSFSAQRLVPGPELAGSGLFPAAAQSSQPRRLDFLSLAFLHRLRAGGRHAGPPGHGGVFARTRFVPPSRALRCRHLCLAGRHPAVRLSRPLRLHHGVAIYGPGRMGRFARHSDSSLAFRGHQWRLLRDHGGPANQCRPGRHRVPSHCLPLSRPGVSVSCAPRDASRPFYSMRRGRGGHRPGSAADAFQEQHRGREIGRRDEPRGGLQIGHRSSASARRRRSPISFPASSAGT